MRLAYGLSFRAYAIAKRGLWPQLPRLCVRVAWPMANRVSIGMLVFARVIPTQRLKWASATTTYPWMSVDNSLYVNKHNKAGFINNYFQFLDKQ
ncbi:hypothetical protein [Moorena bouillonii]|uniref:Uncharacterized protein n=1 Tax=Moorena bouillonii PNG TaxID=568701 RepID=A0A1U7MXH1_9CYAN|nr:hypothetical protein [Moorena bouillonii]OLT58408.1 hypothetical protein BJP37_04455 [Moorena bouillonii PNG]